MRPYSRYSSRCSTTDVVTFDTTDAQVVRPYSRYSSRCSTTDVVTFDTTDAQIVRPYISLHVGEFVVEQLLLVRFL